MKQFGLTSCSAKRSDLFLPKVRYIRKNIRASICNERAAKKTKVHSKKNEGAFGKMQSHWRVCLPAFLFTPWCVRLCFLVKQTHWRSHCIYTGFCMDSHFFFLQKNLRVQNRVQKGVHILSTPCYKHYFCNPLGSQASVLKNVDT